jgi:hypothetical protein
LNGGGSIVDVAWAVSRRPSNQLAVVLEVVEALHRVEHLTLLLERRGGEHVLGDAPCSRRAASAVAM